MTQIPLEAENEFYAAMEREDAEQLEREARAAASARLNALALQLKREFSTAESSRKLIEERWLEDLMQYRGQYPADVMERLKKFKRSLVYYRMTTNKVDMMVARLMDLLFPARSKNWAIQPTPDPEIPGELVEQSPEFMQAVQEVMAEQMQLLQAQNAVPDGLAMQKMQRMAMQEAMRRIDLDTVKLRIAKACADKMEQAARKTQGVAAATVSFMTQKMKVEFAEGADVDAVMQQVLKNCKRVEDDCEIFL